MDPAGFEWTMTLAAGRGHYLFGGHDSLYARCSGLSRQSLWLGQIGPPPVCKSMSKKMFVMIIVQSWRGMDPVGFEWTMTLAAGREHYLFGGHDSLYVFCSELFRQSLWLGQIGPPPVCRSMSSVKVLEGYGSSRV